MTMPALFVSHGSPMIVLEQSPARAFLESHGATLPRPKAILVVTAHFEAAEPTLTGAAAPETNTTPCPHRIKYSPKGL